MEAVAKEDVAHGIIIGKRNMRGMFERIGEGSEMEHELAARCRRWAEHRRVDYPFTGGVLNRIAAWYEEDAEREDRQAILSKRLNTWG